MRNHDFALVAFNHRPIACSIAEIAQRATGTTIPYNIGGWRKTAIRSLWPSWLRPRRDSVTAEQNVVTAKAEEGRTIATSLSRHSARSFKRQFNLADYVQVKSAVRNGLPRSSWSAGAGSDEPRRIPIGHAGNVQQLEARAA